MLEPREADIPALFLFLVVLPLVTYILLGKWNEATKKNTRISMLAQLATEEALRVEAMTTADVIPVGHSLQSGLHECARCFGPATTRCSRCKSVRYCSGKCQIIHWRLGHKEECQQWENIVSNNYNSQASPTEYVHQSAMLNENLKAPFMGNDMKEPMHHNIPSDTSDDPSIADTFQISAMERRMLDRKISRRFEREVMKSEEVTGCSSAEISSCGVTTPTLNPSNLIMELPSKGALRRPKLGNDNCTAADEIPRNQNANSQTSVHAPAASRSIMRQPNKLKEQTTSVFESSTPSCSSSASVFSDKIVINSCETEMEFTSEKVNVPAGEFSKASGGTKFKKPPYTLEPSKYSPQKSETKALGGNPYSGIERKTCIEKESNIPQVTASTTIHAQSNNGISNMGDSKMAGVRKLPKLPKRNFVGIMGDNLKKNKMLFPFEDLFKFFQCEVRDISPRGLLNCGNSCYANAVLQCLTCTKPLMIYLLRRIHSRTCSGRDWCLMCELELHVSMLQESGGPLSPTRILSNMRNIGCRIGGGNQEDAHEFLRLLVMSMQSICLEGLGGEKEVDLRLQETTLIQQIFGGRLKSKVKCLRCHLESERYENIMDLTLEIHGWVESLEDALTQFTAPEDLEGENMYRCGRCSAYVKARKQLSVHEAPNILTIVLKRFQTGKYGKITKCVTFPDMLDMIPYMTGTADSPPLYMLYAAVVHLDTSNASFSGHYVSYVKDLQGTWFRIDDSEVQAVPLSQVMSEGAYMLFYSRSFPRPPRSYSGKATPLQAPASAKHAASKIQKSWRHGPSKPSGDLFASDMSSDVGNNLISKTSGCVNDPTSDYNLKHASRNFPPPKGTFAESVNMDFSDATSSDWSLFTSSDESSFTTESTSDSFSALDYGDTASLDPISSIFSPFSIPEHSQSQSSTISCTKFSHCRPQTRFFSESKGFVLDSSMTTQLLGKVQHTGRNPERVGGGSTTEPLASVSNCSMSVRYGSNPKYSLAQTSGCCDP